MLLIPIIFYTFHLFFKTVLEELIQVFGYGSCLILFKCLFLPSLNLFSAVFGAIAYTQEYIFVGKNIRDPNKQLLVSTDCCALCLFVWMVVF